MARVTIDDLAFAVDWIGTYDSDENDNNTAARDRLVEWLQAEITRREDAVVVRQLVQKTSASATQARRVLAAVRASR